MDRTGCSYCKGRPIANDTDLWNQYDDPYFRDRMLYPQYGRYGQGSWGYGYVSGDYSSTDFTDADATSFDMESNTDYEQDLDAS